MKLISTVLIPFVFILSCKSYKRVIEGNYSFSKTENEVTTFVEGVVTSKENGKPVSYASIYLVGTKIGAEANNLGEFRIEVDSGTYQIQFEYTGFTEILTKQFRLGNNDSYYFNVELGTTLVY